MTVGEIINKEKGNYKVIVIDGIVKSGFTMKGIMQEIKSYTNDGHFLRMKSN